VLETTEKRKQTRLYPLLPLPPLLKRGGQLLGSLFLVSPIIGLKIGSGSAIAGIGANTLIPTITKLTVKLKSDLFFMSLSAT
jgi:hypothetical protein